MTGVGYDGTARSNRSRTMASMFELGSWVRYRIPGSIASQPPHLPRADLSPGIAHQFLRLWPVLDPAPVS